MFSKDQTAGRVVCLADYGRVNMGAIVPITNELYADVEAWMAEGNTLAEFDGYPDVPMNEDQLQSWRASTVASAFQAQQALDDFGYIEQVEAIMTDPATPAKTKRAWKLAQEFRRMSPTVLELAGALGLSEVEIDTLFQHALTIEA